MKTSSRNFTETISKSTARKKRGLLDILYCLGFVTIIGGFGLLSSGSLVNYKSENVSRKTLVSGEETKKLETYYDEMFSVKNVAVNFWTAVEYGLFEEGKRGVVIGSNGWLFTREEFAVSERAHIDLQQNLASILQASNLLRDQDIELVVSVIPSKARVFEQFLKDIRPEKLHRDLYSIFIEFLQDNEIAYTNGLKILKKLPHHTPSYFRQDTHWTPLGARKIAEATASKIALTMGEVAMGSLESQGFVTEFGADDVHHGDLLKFLPLEPWFTKMMPRLDTFSPEITYNDSPYENSDAHFIFGDTVAPISVVLVGTSYSADPTWNFDGALRTFLKVNINNYAKKGIGPIAPMLEYIESHLTTDESTRLVIWEIPERFLVIDYSPSHKALMKLSVTRKTRHSKLTAENLNL